MELAMPTFLIRLIKEARAEPPPIELTIQPNQVRAFAERCLSTVSYLDGAPQIEDIEQSIRDGHMRLLNIPVRVTKRGTMTTKTKREALWVDPILTKLAENAAKRIARAERLDNVSTKEIYRIILETVIAALRAPVHTEGMREALVKAIRAANLLLQNAEGCAINHYGNDFGTHGMPEWLKDTRMQIEEATSALAAAPLTADAVRLATIEECEQAARGPVYKEIYNGRDGHNWSRDSDYGRGRHGAADAVAALAQPKQEAK